LQFHIDYFKFLQGPCDSPDQEEKSSEELASENSETTSESSPANQTPTASPIKETQPTHTSHTQGKTDDNSKDHRGKWFSRYKYLLRTQSKNVVAMELLDNKIFYCFIYVKGITYIIRMFF